MYYYYISGTLAVLEPNMAVVDAGGVGYQLFISGTTLGKLAGKTGQNVKLFTHLSVREDALELYGFYSNDELKAFRMLISVSGIGSKTAVAILSEFTPESLTLAVANGDYKSISKAQGIGKKTAERIVLELKDKLGKELGVSVESDMGGVAAVPSGKSSDEAVSALMSLGYSRNEAQYGVSGAPADADAETLIRYALGKLMKG